MAKTLNVLKLKTSYVGRIMLSMQRRGFWRWTGATLMMLFLFTAWQMHAAPSCPTYCILDAATCAAEKSLNCDTKPELMSKGLSDPTADRIVSVRASWTNPHGLASFKKEIHNRKMIREIETKLNIKF